MGPTAWFPTWVGCRVVLAPHCAGAQWGDRTEKFHPTLGPDSEALQVGSPTRGWRSGRTRALDGEDAGLRRPRARGTLTVRGSLPLKGRPLGGFLVVREHVHPEPPAAGEEPQRLLALRTWTLRTGRWDWTLGGSAGCTPVHIRSSPEVPLQPSHPTNRQAKKFDLNLAR